MAERINNRVKKSYLKATLLVCLSSALLLPTLTQVQAAEEVAPISRDSLFTLSLPELMLVSVASKKEEKMQDAPGIITVITAKEIRLFGARNIRELLNRLTSFQVINSSFLPENTTTIRGQSVTKNDNHVLILIDGRPHRDSNTGGYNAALYLGFPISAIKKIEIIRGPGSVLYGSNAFAGVINIVTQPAGEETTQFSTTIGSFNTREFEAAYSGQLGVFDVMIAGKLLKADGWRLQQAFTATGPTPTEWDTSPQTSGLFGKFKYSDWTLTTMRSEINPNRVSFAPEFTRVERIRDVRTMIDLGYSREIYKNWNIDGNLTYNRHERVNENSDDYLAEVSVRGELSSNLQVIAGAVFEHQTGNILSRDYNRNLDSQFFQLEYTPAEWVKLVAGAQRHNANEFQADYSPRFAAIFNFPNHWGLKLQRAKAFRSPSAQEIFVDNSFIAGSSALSPEIITTSEAQLFYSHEKTFLGLTYYESDYEDIISFVPNPDPEVFLTFGNIGEIKFRGIELEGEGEFANGWFVRSSVSYQENENQDGLKDSTFTPNLMAKIGISYESESGWSGSIFHSYFGGSTPTAKVVPSIADLNPQPKSYNLISAKATLHLPTVLGQKMTDSTLSVYVDNLLDEDIYFSDFNGRSTHSLPLQGGRGIYLKLSINF